MENMDAKIEKAIKPLVNMYEKIENDLLIKIASHFSINDEFINSDYWRIQKLDEMGLFNEEVIEYIARYSNKTKDEVRKAINKIGYDSINIDNLNRLFEDEVLKINPNVLLENYTIQGIINSAYNDLSNRFIELSSKIENSVRDEYLNVVEEAYLKTSMGTHSYQEAIKESINDLSNRGIKILTYTTTDENGNIIGIRNYDVESAVRRDILTNVRKLSNEINMEVSETLESEYVYLTEHLQCRPQHFDWQGTIIKRKDLVKITHYGEVDGLGGINCKHLFEPYFGNSRDDDLKEYTKEQCEKEYKLSQKQRYLERGIRKWKRKAEMYKASDDLKSYSKCKSKIKEWQLKIKEFTEKNDLKRDYIREHVKQDKKVLKYENLTSKLEENFKNNPIAPDRRLNYCLDSVGIKHYDYYFEDETTLHKLDEEIKYQKLLEQYIGEKVYLNPKERTSKPPKSADFVVENIEKTWDLKGIDGNSKNIIDNILNKASKKEQSFNLVLKQRKTNYSIKELSMQIKEIFDNNKRVKIKEIMLFDKNDKLVLYYKR